MSGSKSSDGSFARAATLPPEAQGDHPLGLTVHTLPEAERALPALSATALDGKAVPLASLKGQWLLVSVAGGACDAACQKHLYLQRQLRESVGKEKDRVDWVWLVNDATSVPPELTPALQKATVLRMDAAALNAWLAPAEGHQI